jgi:DMSO/TMAO reductase YedYZ molybdopterin-dependent catalytic subunit
MNKNVDSNPLPPGQKERITFPRFGLPHYANRYQEDFGPIELHISGEMKQSFTLTEEHLSCLTRCRMTSDFHCVTTWTKRDIRWGGIRFVEFYQSLIEPKVKKDNSIYWVVFKSLDGYRSRILLNDILDSNVFLADELNDRPLCSKHGAPLRLVAPKHYGYKNPKHINRIEFHGKDYKFKPPLLSFMEHPRARVEFEERGRFFPGWVLRYFYRPMITSTIEKFKQGMFIR